MTSRVLILLAVATWLALATFSFFRPAPLRAQVPAPSPTPAGESNSCGPADYRGGQTITVLNLQITLLAPGDYSVGLGKADPLGTFVRICYVQGDSSVFFKADGSERNRVVNNASASAVLNEIARSVRVVATPTPASGGCPGPGSIPGGRTVLLVNGLSVSLPANGDYFVLITPAGGQDTLVGVCYVQGEATVYFSINECKEVRRTSAGAAANAILDQIVRSCTREVPPTLATPQPVVTPTGTVPPPTVPLPGIRPPDTGSGGLVASSGSGAGRP
jgi:hypothetical protein